MDTAQNFYCPGCSLEGGDGSLPVGTNCNASNYCWGLYQELTLYTFSLGDEEFIHQHVADAYTAQHSSNKLKNIQIWFALIGLYLFLEHKYSGKAVQRVHRKLAESTKDWPQIALMKSIAGITVNDILSAESGDMRKRAIHSWSEVIWQAWQQKHEKIIGRYTQIGG